MKKFAKRLGTFAVTATLATTLATADTEAATYTVKSGDTLAEIAQNYNTTVSNLQKTNSISGYLIYPGQTISTSGSIRSGNDYFNWPAKGITTSGYGYRSSGLHLGIDISNNTGTPIRAAASGEVTRSGYSSSYGNVVYVYHPQFNKTTVYAHMSDRDVSYGQPVSAGQTIGNMGQTGHAYGTHLHFEVHKGAWNYRAGINPMPYLD